MQKIFIAIPTHTGDIRAGTLLSVVNATVECVRRGIDVFLHCWEGDSLIPNARNIQLAYFLQSDCTDMVCVDADIRCEAEDFMRLVGHKTNDIVGGGYRFKRDAEDYPIDWLPDPEGKGLWSHPDHGMIEVAGIPTGFMRIPRSVAEKMVEANGGRWYRSNLAPDLKIPCLFELVLENRTLRGEDYAFCKKWRDLGGKVWLDPLIKLHHQGHKEYRGDIGTWLRTRGTEPKPEEVARLITLMKDPEMQKLFDVALGEKAA